MEEMEGGREGGREYFASYRIKGLMKKVGKKTRDTKQADVNALSESLIKLSE